MHGLEIVLPEVVAVLADEISESGVAVGEEVRRAHSQ